MGEKPEAEPAVSYDVDYTRHLALVPGAVIDETRTEALIAQINIDRVWNECRALLPAQDGPENLIILTIVNTIAELLDAAQATFPPVLVTYDHAVQMVQRLIRSGICSARRRQKKTRFSI